MDIRAFPETQMKEHNRVSVFLFEMYIYTSFPICPPAQHQTTWWKHLPGYSMQTQQPKERLNLSHCPNSNSQKLE